MAYRKISEVTFGGTGVDNPSPLNFYESYRNEILEGDSFVHMNVIAHEYDNNVDLQVTGVVAVVNGQLQVGPNDKVYLPCPPFCARGNK